MVLDIHSKMKLHVTKHVIPREDGVLGQSSPKELKRRIFSLGLPN